MEKKIKFNIVDIAVIAVLIVGVLFVGSRLLGNLNVSESSSSTYQVTFFAECAPEAIVNHLSVGASAENSDGTVPLGQLVSFSTDASVVYVPLDSGEIVASTQPGYVSCTLTCELSAEQTDVGLLAGSHELNVGHEMTVRAGNVEVECYVQDIVALDAA